MRGKQATLAWAFLTRAGSERDLVEELGEEHRPETIAEGLVVSASRPRDPDGSLANPAFARQAMRLDGPPSPLEPERLADRLARAMKAHLPQHAEPWRWTLQLVAPDSSDPRDPRRRAVLEIEPMLREALLARLPETLRGAFTADTGPADRFVQAWALDEERAIVGVTTLHQVVSRVPGGKIKFKRPIDAPSRSGLKLEEAIDWVGVGPEKGEICADLGASPGGWSQVAVRRGATVIAVDPAPIKVDLPRKRFTSLRESAFDFAPSETLDWLLCDMAWRPLEVAQLCAKWGRRSWARQMIANFKLPMKRKADILMKIMRALEQGGWRGLRARQLYFDRDEITIYGWLDPTLARQNAKPPFALRAANRGRARKRGPRAKRNRAPSHR